MSWKVKCPHCGTAYRVEVEHQGAVSTCAKCRREFSIPEDMQAFIDDFPAPPEITRKVIRQDDFKRLRNLKDELMKKCPDCGEISKEFANCCSLCGYNFVERKSRHQDASSQCDDDVRYCFECGRKVRFTTESCPECGFVLCYHLKNQYQPKKPFLCGVLNVIGGIPLVISSLFLIFLLIRFVHAWANPSDNVFTNMSDSQMKNEIAGIFIVLGVFFGSLIVLGISSLIAKASRNWQ